MTYMVLFNLYIGQKAVSRLILVSYFGLSYRCRYNHGTVASLGLHPVMLEGKNYHNGPRNGSAASWKIESRDLFCSDGHGFNCRPCQLAQPDTAAR